MCRMLPFLSCLLLIGLLHAPTQSEAALKPKGSATAEESWNPAPSAGDVILPMPCNLGMVFRVLAVPAKGFLWDMTTRMGRDDVAHVDRAYYDSRYTSSLSGPFALEDLPPAWRQGLPTGDYRYYLMGKYEISGMQWKAVMDASCPAPSAEDARPKTEVSWYDAVEFSRRYTTWLLEKHPEALPYFKGDERNVGFARLPTESEWEYAARGAHTSTSQWLLEQDFFPMAEGTAYTDYAVFRPEAATRLEEHAARIGSRKPNAAGLHDTAGNAAEMVMDVFRFSLGGRLHGSAGGFVRKGGSYLSGTAEIMPGRREETAFFQSKGPMLSRDLGFRLVISGINTPGGNRPDVLKREWQKAGEEQALLLDNTRNPLEEIDRLMAMARSDAEKENFQRLRTVIKENNIALERQQMLSAESMVRTAAFMIETVRNFGIRIAVTDIQLQDMERAKKRAEAKGVSSDAAPLIANSLKQRANHVRGREQSLAFYKAKLDDALTMQPALLDAAIAKVEKEMAQGDEFNKKLQGNIQLYAKHIQAVRKKQFKALTTDQLLRDMVPPKK